MLTRAVLECLMRIRNQEEFRAFREYLLQERDFDLAILANANEDRVMHLSQGAYRRMQMLLEVIENAPALLDKEAQKQAGTSSSP